MSSNVDGWLHALDSVSDDVENQSAADNILWHGALDDIVHDELQSSGAHAESSDRCLNDVLEGGDSGEKDSNDADDGEEDGNDCQALVLHEPAGDAPSALVVADAPSALVVAAGPVDSPVERLQNQLFVAANRSKTEFVASENLYYRAASVHVRDQTVSSGTGAGARMHDFGRRVFRSTRVLTASMARNLEKHQCRCKVAFDTFAGARFSWSLFCTIY